MLERNFPQNSPLTIADLVRNLRPSLVQIVHPSGAGSGFIISRDGLVVTNAHVVENQLAVTVRMDNRREYNARILGTDEIADIALARIQDGRNFKPMFLGDSDAVAVGEEVVALGFPLEDYVGRELTVTRGIVSSKRRREDIAVLQTDAAMNPGNSGGPLLTLDGRVVGVNTWRLDLSSIGVPTDNMGFSISVNELKTRIESLTSGKSVARSHAPTVDEWATYRSELFGYEIDIAPGWDVLVEDDELGVVVTPIYGERLVDHTALFVHPYFLDDRRPISEFVMDMYPDPVVDGVEVLNERRVYGERFWVYWTHFVGWNSNADCVMESMRVIAVSSQYPQVPLGFVAEGMSNSSGGFWDLFEKDIFAMLSGFRP